MSKSGLFAHFRSKEELQLATIETAGALFAQHVVGPAFAETTTGYDRLRALAERFLRHLEDEVFPGGCFFASVAAEVDTRPGLVRDRAIEVLDDWVVMLETAVREAQAEGAIDPGEDPAQLVFELDAYLLLANAQFVIDHDRSALDRARLALDRRLSAAAPASS
jgi:AcrR family transcriptional regulator